MSDDRAMLDALEESMEQQTVVELTDDEGRVVRFRFVAALEHEAKTYVVLADMEPEQDSEDELVLLRVEHGDDGEDRYIMLDDEQELQDVFEQYIACSMQEALEGLEDVEMAEEADCDCGCGGACCDAEEACDCKHVLH